MTELLFSFEDVDVYSQHLTYFGPGQWLDDVCINLCYRLMEKQHSSENCLFVDPSVVSFIRLQLDDDEEFQDLSRGQNFSEKNWIFLPISDSESFDASGTHWSLLIWQYSTGKFFHADSSGTYNQSSAHSLARKLLMYSGQK